MLTNENRRKDVLLFIAGALSVLSLFLLTGAGAQSPIGKYDITVAHRGETHLIYVIDTTTGSVRWVDSMNTPFTELKKD
jgi:hypothetical protein